MYLCSTLQWHLFFTIFSFIFYLFFLCTDAFVFIFFYSLLLKEPAFINERSCNGNVIPLCIAGECMSAVIYRDNNFAVNTVWVFFLHCKAYWEKKKTQLNKYTYFMLSALMLVSQSWQIWIHHRGNNSLVTVKYDMAKFKCFILFVMTYQWNKFTLTFLFVPCDYLNIYDCMWKFVLCLLSKGESRWCLET